MDDSANVIRMVYEDGLLRTATIESFSTLVRIDDDRCAAIRKLTNAQMALVEDFLKRELKIERSVAIIGQALENS